MVSPLEYPVRVPGRNVIIGLVFVSLGLLYYDFFPPIFNFDILSTSREIGCKSISNMTY